MTSLANNKEIKDAIGKEKKLLDKLAFKFEVFKKN